MYPCIRLGKEMILAAMRGPMEVDTVHESRHICWPWDLDFQFEMNNGRVLTLYDLGRIPAAYRVGLLGVMRAEGWGFAMAGASVRYRRRVRAFQKIRMTTSVAGRDERFFYIVQTMWRGDEAASNILYRAAMANADGIVPTQVVAERLGRPDWNPELPGWVRDWIAAEDARPWPPEV